MCPRDKNSVAAKWGNDIWIRHDVDGANWRLSVSDNGVGLRKNGHASTGLGASIVEALAKQLNARVEILSGPPGTTVSISHESPSRMACVA